jgi:hypothetical protein
LFGWKGLGSKTISIVTFFLLFGNFQLMLLNLYSKWGFYLKITYLSFLVIKVGTSLQVVLPLVSCKVKHALRGGLNPQPLAMGTHNYPHIRLMICPVCINE